LSSGRGRYNFGNWDSNSPVLVSLVCLAKPKEFRGTKLKKAHTKFASSPVESGRSSVAVLGKVLVASANLGYELSPSPKIAKRKLTRQLVPLSFSRRRFRQNLMVFLGMSPWPVVDITNTTREARSRSLFFFFSSAVSQVWKLAECWHAQTNLNLSISSTSVRKCSRCAIWPSSEAISSLFPVSVPYKMIMFRPSMIAGWAICPSSPIAAMSRLFR